MAVTISAWVLGIKDKTGMSPGCRLQSSMVEASQSGTCYPCSRRCHCVELSVIAGACAQGPESSRQFLEEGVLVFRSQ